MVLPHRASHSESGDLHGNGARGEFGCPHALLVQMKVLVAQKGGIGDLVPRIYGIGTLILGTRWCSC